MKIAYISSSAIPSRTANSIHVMKMCQAFAKNGHKVVLFAPDRRKEYEKNVDDVYKFYGVKNNFSLTLLPWLPLRFVRNIYYAIRVLFRLLKDEPDFVYGRDLYSCFIVSHFFDVYYESHAPMSSKAKRFILDRMLNKKRFHKLIVISNELKLILQAQHQVDESKILVAHDAADEIEEAVGKVSLRGTQGALKVGYVGNLYKGKGIEIIEKIAKDLNNQNIEIHVVGGFPEDVKFWSKRISHSNVYFYGFVSQCDLQPYIRALDICLLPNQKVVMPYGAGNSSANISNFTSPLKMFEYMAGGKAIVASDLPALREVLNKSNSIMCDPERPEEWVQAIIALKDRRLLIRLGNKAQEDFRESYTWLRRAEAVISKKTIGE